MHVNKLNSCDFLKMIISNFMGKYKNESKIIAICWINYVDFLVIMWYSIYNNLIWIVLKWHYTNVISDDLKRKWKNGRQV